MLDDAPHASSRMTRRLVWVAVALIALPLGIGALTIALLTSSTTHKGSSQPTVAPAVIGTSGSAACAPNNRTQVNSTRAGAGATLVPPGATAVLLCRYGPTGALVLKRSITSRAIAYQLSWELNALPSDKGAFSCPSDNGEAIVADFSYASGAENPVSVGLSGCQTVTNGHVSRLGTDHPVIGQLQQLVPWVGEIRGRLEICGGPAPGACRTTTAYGVCTGSRCLSADQVAILHRIGAQYANVKLHRGRFSVLVEPGRYRLVLLGDGRLAHGRVLDRVRVTVRAHRATRVTFKLQAR